MALQEEFEKQGNVLFKYRSYFPLLLFPPAIVTIYYTFKYHPYYYQNGHLEFLMISSIIIGLIGLLIRIYTVGHTPKNTSGRNTHHQVADSLNTSGIYSIVRHPLYVGNFLMWLAIAMLTMNLWFVVAFVLSYWLYYERIMYAEEQFLRRKFGTTYTSWADTKPAFIPSISQFQSPKESFSWKKVLKKEKNGVFALFLIFWLFYLYVGYLNTHEFTFTWHWTAIGAMISGIFYFVFKIIKSNTNWLDESSR